MRTDQAPSDPKTGIPLVTLPGIGPVTAGWLNEAGIETLEDLQERGSLAAWKRLKFLRPRQVSLNALYALEAVLRGVSCAKLGPDVRAELKRQAAALSAVGAATRDAP